jgi:hypothetical protein
MPLTGKFYLRRRIFGGYNVYVQFKDNLLDNYWWRRGTKHEVAEVIDSKVQ